VTGSTRIPALSRRQMLGVLGAGAALPFLASCAGPGSSAGGGGGGGGALSQWYHQYGEAGTEDAAKKYAAAYTEQTVNVNWVAGDYGSTLQTRLLSGSGLDVFENNGINVTDARAGRYADLTDIIEPIKDQYSEAALRPVTIDDKYWGVPMILDPQLFYYRKSAFSDAGLQVPETIEDLYDAAKALTSGSNRGIFIGNADGGAGLIDVLAWAAGGATLNDDNTTSGLDNDGVAEGLSVFQKMYAENLQLQGQPSDTWDITPFAQGAVPIQWCGMWGMPQAIEALGEDEIGVFPMPAIGSNGAPALRVSSWHEQVAASSSQVDAAKAFVKWLWVDQTDYQEDWSLSYGFHIPPRSEVAAGADKLQSGPAAEVVKFADEFGRAGTPFWTADINTAASDAANRVILENADPKAELASAASKINSAAEALQQ
jgi:multiple sugar transport system substrate-binding protein